MRGNTRRCQAENPLIALSSFLEPALLSSSRRFRPPIARIVRPTENRRMILRLMERRELEGLLPIRIDAHAARVRHEERPASHTDFGGRVLSDCSPDAMRNCT